jgi:hypothetical protein
MGFIKTNDHFGIQMQGRDQHRIIRCNCLILRSIWTSLQHNLYLFHWHFFFLLTFDTIFIFFIVIVCSLVYFNLVLKIEMSILNLPYNRIVIQIRRSLRSIALCWSYPCHVLQTCCPQWSLFIKCSRIHILLSIFYYCSCQHPSFTKFSQNPCCNGNPIVYLNFRVRLYHLALLFIYFSLLTIYAHNIAIGLYSRPKKSL